MLLILSRVPQLTCIWSMSVGVPDYWSSLILWLFIWSMLNHAILHNREDHKDINGPSFFNIWENWLIRLNLSNSKSKATDLPMMVWWWRWCWIAWGSICHTSGTLWDCQHWPIWTNIPGHHCCTQYQIHFTQNSNLSITYIRIVVWLCPGSV